jgi:hypothetical protein
MMKVYCQTVFIFIAVTAFSAMFAEVPPCFRDLENNFFRPNLVNEALSMHSVFQSTWTPINQQLSRNARRAPEIIRARAKQMDPNPLGTPFLPKEASWLLQQVLLEIFSETLTPFHVVSPGKIEEMFQYIREKQIQRFHACFGDDADIKRNP